MKSNWPKHINLISRREALLHLGYTLGGAFAITWSFRSTAINMAHTIHNRGIYVPGWKAVNEHRVAKLLAFMVENNLNTLMIDVKNAYGKLFYKPQSKLAQTINAQTTTVDGHYRALHMGHLLQQAKKYGIRLIARHVMFSDQTLFNQMPTLNIERGFKQYWVNMMHQQVINYNLELLAQEADMGFDEIVLDYIRFPDMNGFGTEQERCKRIDHIVETVSKLLKPKGVKLGLQIFGYSAWSHRFSNVGQRIETLQHFADYIYPMLYPSHFHKKTMGFSDPNKHPYEIISMGYKAAVSKIESDCKIIPMLQCFSYSPENIAKQIIAVKDNHMPGYICWNPSGNYSPLSDALNLLP